MNTPSPAGWLRAPLLALALLHAPAPRAAQPAEPSAPAVAELRFGDLFQRPIGPRGLHPSARLLALDGQPVRMRGYMADAEQPMAGRLVLTPLPSAMGDEDEHLADDLPPQAVFVHLSGAAAEATLPHHPGLLRLQGRLSVGPHEEPDGHVSTVRLLLDEAQSRALLGPSAPGH